jgi:sigma-B regulation protein RsbU (phosphoserine phosphatase)
VRIRWKVLLVLLTFGLVPMLVANAINRQSVEGMGRAISATAQAMITDMVGEQVVATAESDALLLKRSKQNLEAAATMLALLVEKGLAQDPGQELPRIYWSQEYADPRHAPRDYGPAEGYAGSNAAGERTPLAVSLDNPVFHLPADVDRTKEIERRAAAIASIMSRNYGIIANDFGKMLTWSHFTLESGLHMTYPGHGEHPPDYDPRDERWYQIARQDFAKGAYVVWTLPEPDPVTGNTVMTVTCTIDRDGEFAGVAAMTVPLREVLLRDVVTSSWSARSHTIVTELRTNPASGREELFVIASERIEEGPGQSRSSRWIFRDDVDYRRMIRDLQRGLSGRVDMEHDGAPSIWAYAPVQGDMLHFIVIVPEAVARQLPNAISSVVTMMTDAQFLVAGLAGLFVLVAVVLVAFYGSRSITRPFLQVTDAFRRLGQGDFGVRLSAAHRDERRVIVDTFNETVPKLEQLVTMQRDMLLAQEVQRNLLPRTAPDLPGYDVAGESLYCDETGGDYFDFQPLQSGDTNSWAVLVGDVSGHGVSSALLMATARALIKAVSLSGADLAERITAVNRLLTQDTFNSGRFMTLLCLEMDAEEGVVHWVRAGHDPAIFYDPVNDSFTEPMGDGLALGIVPDYVYQEFTTPFSTPGSIIVIGTDGIWESRNDRNEMFGKQRLYEVIRANAQADAATIQRAVFEALTVFMNGATQEDDITLAVIKKS